MRRSQWLTSVDFPTPAQATIVTTLICWFAHASFRKAISSSRPKTSLPVIGNLDTEIFSGVLARGAVCIAWCFTSNPALSSPVDPQRHLCSARKSFRLLLFADRGANRVTRLEQIPGEARQERFS